MRNETRLVSVCWHPDPPAEFLDLGRDINARVLVGNPAYQLSSGEKFAV